MLMKSCYKRNQIFKENKVKLDLNFMYSRDYTGSKIGPTIFSKEN
jgi:hypothetical protein